METVQCFRHDKWLVLSPEELEPGDHVLHNGQSGVVTEKPTYVKGRWRVPATNQEQGPIQVDLSNGVLAKAMDYAGTGLEVFADGTAILADLQCQPGFVYSPRLPKDELEAFCAQHLDSYKAFFETNKAMITMGESVAMTPWWK